MEKTFGTCKHGYLLEWCKPHCTPVGCESCGFHKPRETPLLVDVLAAALKNVWGGRFTDGGGDCGCERPGYTVLLTPEQCEIIRAALARYQEES